MGAVVRSGDVIRPCSWTRRKAVHHPGVELRARRHVETAKGFSVRERLAARTVGGHGVMGASLARPAVDPHGYPAVVGDRPFWRTEIGRVRPGEILVRGFDLTELIGRRSFGDVTFLLLAGELPAGNEGRMLEAMLVAAAEHSLVAPSVDAARFVASAGVPLQSAVAGGITAMGEHHGGAVDASARALLAARETGRPDGEAAREVGRRLKEEGARLPGFGHVVHDPDPRAGRLFQVAEELGLRGAWCSLAEAFEAAAEEVFGHPLRMNVDGAMAALLLELGLDPRLGKAFYVIGRTPGLVAHVFEEQTRERPYRDIGWENVSYEGPDRRPLPD